MIRSALFSVKNTVALLFLLIFSASVYAGENVTYKTHLTRLGEPTKTDDHFLNGWRTGMLESAFRNQESLNSSKIEIHAMDRHITLNGYVDTEAAKALAEEIALSIQGVDHVMNNLLVYQAPEADSPAASYDIGVDERSKYISKIVADNEISTLVKSKLLSNRATRDSDVDVVVDGDIVILTGEVNSQTESDLIFYIAHNTHGVREVINKLIVLSSS